MSLRRLRTGISFRAGHWRKESDHVKSGTVLAALVAGNSRSKFCPWKLGTARPSRLQPAPHLIFSYHQTFISTQRIAFARSRWRGATRASRALTTFLLGVAVGSEGMAMVVTRKMEAP
jgi:hypothetical protein